MLIILCSNYLTIIAISLMIILLFFFSPHFAVVQWFSMMQAVRLGPPLGHLSVSKEYTKGCVIIPLHHSLGFPGHTFKQKDGKEADAAVLLSPQMLCTETDWLWNPPSCPSANLC